MTYAKLPQGETLSAIASFTTTDEHTAEADLLERGFLPFTATEPPGDPEAGHRWAARYRKAESAVIQEWAQEAYTPPPRTFKRSYLAQWIRANGKWAALQALLQSSEEIAFFWDYSTEFDEDHEDWPEALAAVKTALGLTDAEAEEMLESAARGD